MIKYSVSKLSNSIDKEKSGKAYARTQAQEWVTLEAFAEHISSHNSPYDKGDVYAVLAKAVRCLREMVLDGKRVSLGDLGSFYATVASEGADSVAAFDKENIKSVTMTWEKGDDLKNMLADADLQKVSTRAVQKAALRAHKAGKSVASWSKDKSSQDNKA